MFAGEPLVISIDIPEMFADELESDAVNVNAVVRPKPDAGLTEVAVGAPPVTFHPPTNTNPEDAPGSTAFR